MSYKSTILITGGSSGLGYETSLQLAKSHPDLLIVAASRSSPAEELLSLANVKWFHLDLSTKAATRSFVTAFLAESFPPISALILNAGLQRFPKVYYTPDGLEEMVETNHLNQALLFFLLQERLEPTARIVVVSSSVHDPEIKRGFPEYTTAEAAAHPQGESYKSFQGGIDQYAVSKLCQLLFAYALHDHIVAAGKSWIVLALDPGVMPTGLFRWTPGIVRILFNWFLRSGIPRLLIASDYYPVAETARSLVKLAMDPEFAAKEKSGKYYVVMGPAESPSSKLSHDKAIQKDLWDWTVKELGVQDEVKALGFE
ncbi:dehydrogenase/reductase [Naematelia encephala]|uniref:Dehydrogenase/reductase n=1 Tax=Naematelia encephala TaxID=71784 RepID=A0A1Y2BAN1_9TREE|nr:dehydrogenase/reductase [Naematelia encephala]